MNSGVSMIVATRFVIALLGTGLGGLAMAATDADDEQSAWRLKEEETTSSSSGLIKADRLLASALRAPNADQRTEALRNAQSLLDQAQASAGEQAISDEETGLERSEEKVARMERSTAIELRQTLMRSIWRSPYIALPEDDIDVLERVGDALRLLREIERLDLGDAEAIHALQATYWRWLENRADTIGLKHVVIETETFEAVFDQQVLRSESGDVMIYQLLGRDDKTLRWVKIPSSPVTENLLQAEGLDLNLKRESARWLMVMAGAHLGARLAAHAHWLESIAGQVRLVLRERQGYGETLRSLPEEWFSPNRLVPYVLPAPGDTDANGVFLVDVASARTVGHWPLESLDGPGAPVVKEFINRILAADPR